MWIVSAVSLIVIVVSCTVGVFAPRALYDDNLLQRVGMSGMVFFCLPRLMMILDEQALSARCMPATAQLLGHVGVACYCVGVWIETLRNRRCETESSTRVA